jgi:hypothetical protein
VRRQRARLRKPARMDDSYISHTLQINSPHMKGVTSIRLIERKHADSEGGAPPDTLHEAYAVASTLLMNVAGVPPQDLAQWAIDARPLCVLWTKRAGLAPHPCGRAGPRIVHALSLGVDMEPTLATRLHARDELEKRVASLNEDDERGAGAEENAAAMSRYATWFHINLKPT